MRLYISKFVNENNNFSDMIKVNSSERRRFRVTDSAAPLHELFTVFKVSSRPIMRRVCARGTFYAHNHAAEIASRAGNSHISVNNKA